MICFYLPLGWDILGHKRVISGTRWSFKSKKSHLTMVASTAFSSGDWNKISISYKPCSSASNCLTFDNTKFACKQYPKYFHIFQSFLPKNIQSESFILDNTIRSCNHWARGNRKKRSFCIPLLFVFAM